MKVELICVGSELVSGKTLNTNASYISKKLLEIGHSCERQYTVADDMLKVAELVEGSLPCCDVLILTGGLGPTNDDITKEAVCRALGLRLVENKKCKEHIERYFSLLGKEPTPNNFKQALAPEGAEIFKNERGTACGIGIVYEGKRIILLPGPPKELEYMFEAYIIPYLKKLDRKSVVTHTINVFGMGESAIENAIRPLFTSDNPVVVTYCQDNECEISVTATEENEEEAERLCSAAVFKIKSLLGDVVYGIDSNSLADEVVKLLRKEGLKVATAESCTGGMLSQALTSVKGSSEVVEIGITAYSNRIKNEALSVPLDVLMEEGAISAETAMYLAKNVRMLSDSDIGVGITGNAGPTASENKPVGLVYIAIADRSKYYIIKLELPAGYGREKIRNYATLTALNVVRKYVLARPGSLEGMRSYDDEFVFEESTQQPVTENEKTSFAVYKVDENFDLEQYYKNLHTENDGDTPLDINSFISAEENIQSDIFERVLSFVKLHWIKLVSALVLVALLVASVLLIGNLVHEGRQSALVNAAREEFDLLDNSKSEDTGIFTSFNTLMKQNSDITGWISISGTNINNPVYQTVSNTYYLTHNMKKENSAYGALFFDRNSSINKNSTDKNLTIYGHNTTNGTMFAELDSYHSLSFYKSNPVINLKTLYEQNDYLIFAVFITNADPDDDNGQIFNYARSKFTDAKDFDAFIKEALKRSLITVPVSINHSDSIITLSTRSDEFDNARFVVMAKKINNQGEVSLASKATLNTNAKYPQAWYDVHNLIGYTESEAESSDIISSDETDSTETDASSSDPTSSDLSSSVPSASAPTSSTPTSSAPTASKPVSSVASTGQNTSSVDPATCKHTPAKYSHKDALQHVYNCANCGTEVIEAHSFEFEKVDPAYLSTEATCSEPATYFKSCKCLIKGTETFIYGEALTHIASPDYTTDDTHHWHFCQNGECAEMLNKAEHSYDANNKCVCGKDKPVE